MLGSVCDLCNNYYKAYITNSNVVLKLLRNKRRNWNGNNYYKCLWKRGRLRVFHSKVVWSILDELFDIFGQQLCSYLENRRCEHPLEAEYETEGNIDQSLRKTWIDHFHQRNWKCSVIVVRLSRLVAEAVVESQENCPSLVESHLKLQKYLKESKGASKSGHLWKLLLPRLL